MTKKDKKKRDDKRHRKTHDDTFSSNEQSANENSQREENKFTGNPFRQNIFNDPNPIFNKIFKSRTDIFTQNIISDPPSYLEIANSIEDILEDDDNGYYRILGVSKTCTNQSIKHAYKRASLKFHPDKGGNAEHVSALNSISLRIILMICEVYKKSRLNCQE
jgi:hypothetical protein